MTPFNDLYFWMFAVPFSVLLWAAALWFGGLMAAAAYGLATGKF
jgi:hypothetical protein